MSTVTVLGSVNVDLVATCDRLPRPGETRSATSFNRFPGGKGANQALAAQRCGSNTRLVAAVGADPDADFALELLGHDGVDLSSVAVVAEPTGLAMIAVDGKGENQIVVVPGANGALHPDMIDVIHDELVLCQLEVPMDVVEEAARTATGLFCVNAAPALPLPESVLDRADLLIVNESEREALGESLEGISALVVVTMGAAGAKAFRSGRLVAEAQPPAVVAIDTVGAGDAFCGALVTALLEGRSVAFALRWACAAGALATTRRGAQVSAPRGADIAAVMGS